MSRHRIVRGRVDALVVEARCVAGQGHVSDRAQLHLISWLRGDAQARHNLPGRPIFDPLEVVFFLVGLVAFRDLIANGHARLLGPSRLARAFPTWFDTSYFAEGLRRAEQRHKPRALPAKT